MFDMDSRPTIVKSVEKSADSGIEWADSTDVSPSNPLRIGLWVRALKVDIMDDYILLSSLKKCGKYGKIISFFWVAKADLGFIGLHVLSFPVTQSIPQLSLSMTCWV